MTNISKRSREKQFKSLDHQKFLSRITKTLYYTKLPSTERLSLPVTELAAEIFSEAQEGRSLERLHSNDAASISRNACISPCSFILALLYLERLKTCNPDYLQKVAPSELFLVSLMIANKFLHDDGEEDEVFIDEWAVSGGITVKHLKQLEKEFLNAIQWEIFVNERTFWRKLMELETTIAKREGFNRGFFTYSELENLLKTVEVYKLIQCFATLFSVLLVTYTAAILTIIGSMIIVSNIPGNFLQNSQGVANRSLVESEMNSTEMAPFETDVFCLDKLDVDLKTEAYKSRPLDVINLLQTRFFLASIKTLPSVKENSFRKRQLSTESTQTDPNVECISWDWWTSSLMTCLTENSRLSEDNDALPYLKQYVKDRFFDMSVANLKVLNSEDQLHKPSKVRLQDQMECSWHKEWTDMVQQRLFTGKQIAHYFQNIRS